MAFHDVRLPTAVELGAQGGPNFKTTVISLSGGNEKRNIDWVNTRGSWDIGYGLQAIEDRYAVRDFFFARQGRAHSFRFKDHADFEIPDGMAAPQDLEDGDGADTTFQIVKKYTSGGVTFNRTILKPIESTVRMFLDSIETSAFSVDDTTGIVTMDAPPGNGVMVGVICEYDVPVRFDTDQLLQAMLLPDFVGIPDISIIEVRID